MGQSLHDAVVIYNLFPRLVASLHLWVKHLSRISDMGFNSIYVNPFQETGNSRSLYAVKDYYRLNQEFLPEGSAQDDFSPIRQFIRSCEDYGIDVYMDLVINHTANESVLVKQHPQWYKHDYSGNVVHPFAIDPANPSNVTVWGDLAELDFEHTSDLTGLLKYWDGVISFYQELGFAGFRCDAAYKVPCSVFQPLIAAAKKRNHRTLFFAETLGCTLNQVQHLNGCGFDYLFNSCKWWNFDSSWCLEQHEQFKSIAPSIGFPESHDTLRTPAEAPGSLNWHKNRYILAAVFSKGLLMPMGYETGAISKIDVVNSRPQDLQYGKWDVTEWIKAVNIFKLNNPLLCQEGKWRALWSFDSNILFLLKESEDQKLKMGFLVNKDWYNPISIPINQFPHEIADFKYRVKPFDDPLKRRKNDGDLELGPSEICLFVE
jgi:starch synthase (maltosyl-transferring)